MASATVGAAATLDPVEEDAMIKLVYCLRRLPHLSLEEFQRYWWEIHGPLVRSRADTLRIRRYVQVHTLDNPINNVLRESRGALAAYDGVAELWWNSLEDLAAVTASPEGPKAIQELIEDERRFVDLERSALWIGEEHSPPPATAAKRTVRPS